MGRLAENEFISALLKKKRDYIFILLLANNRT
jgi:hypothetical protein